MASFDLIQTVGLAYRKTWQERHYLLRMALVPLIIKFTCHALALLYAPPENILRYSLMMLPAYFAEGWFLAHWARTVVLDHRWPFRPTGDAAQDNDAIQKRARGVLGGTVSFVLINLLMAGYFAFFMSYIPLDMTPETADPKVAAIGVVMMITSFFLFRYIWMYVTLAVNLPVEIYIRAVKPLGLTFSMLGVWLVCFMPTMMIMQLIGGALTPEAASDGFSGADGLIIVLRITMDMIKNILCAAGMAYLFMHIFRWKIPNHEA